MPAMHDMSASGLVQPFLKAMQCAMTMNVFEWTVHLTKVDKGQDHARREGRQRNR